MFGKKPGPTPRNTERRKAAATPDGSPVARPDTDRPGPAANHERPGGDSEFREIKQKIFGILIEQIDASKLLRMTLAEGRREISRLINDIIISKLIQVSRLEEERLLNEIADDMLGFGPLERFLSRDDISDIMVNGADRIYIEIDGVVHHTDVRFRDNQQLLNVCQRIVSLVGRRVDESSPICDARLKDGSRVNVIISPLSLDGPSLTIRRFKKDKLTLAKMVDYGSISSEGAEILRILARTRCNILVSGGTGSGKTTLLNALTGHVEHNERIVTCEDTAELQLQQPHVVRLETRPSNIEGRGEVTMRDLVKNCLRMRPDRIIVGEVRGPEAFDLLQAMNTGHDGSMGTLHANSPEEAISRVEAMVTMGYSGLSTEIIRQMFCASIDIIIQIARLRDGSRKITHITEVLGTGGGDFRILELFRFRFTQTDDRLKIGGVHVAASDPSEELMARARYYDEGENLQRALAAAREPAP